VSPQDAQAFQALVDASLPTVRAMVQAWRTGLAGLVTLVTTGVVITGRDVAAELTPGWLAAVTVTIGGGLVLAVVGLWHTLAAEVGARAQLHTLNDMRARYASVEAYQVGLAAAAARRLQTARGVVAVALALLLTGVLLTWWAPPAPADPPAFVRVTTPAGVTCGELRSGDGGTLRLAVDGAHDEVAIPLGNVRNLAVTDSC